MCDRPKEKVDAFIESIEKLWAATTGYGDVAKFMNDQLNKALKELHDAHPN